MQMLKRSLVMALVLACALLAAPRAGFAQSGGGELGAALDLLAANSYTQTGKAIDAIAQSGTPQAIAILEAMGDRRLLIDPASKGVYVKAKTGGFVDAATGKAVKRGGDGLTAVRVNNRLRNAIEAALGSLVLRSPDPEKRRLAADAMFKSRQSADLPRLDKAIAAEKNASVALEFERARAAILLSAPESNLVTRLRAVQTLGTWHDSETLGLLRGVRSANAPGELQTAIDDAIKRIEHHRQLLSALQDVVYGLSLGSVLLLAAIGLAITFGVMGVINMAHGEMVMLGAYTTYVVQEGFRAWAPGAFDLSLMIAIPMAFLVAGLVGVIIERGIIRFLYGRPLETLLATWGVSLMLQQAVRTAFGPTNKEVGNPSFMSGAIDLWGLSITWSRLWIIVFTLAVFAGLQLVLRKTRLGLEMRAVTQNRRMASSMGIRSARVDALTFGLGSGIAGIAGVALSQIDNVSPNLGQSYIVDSFMVVVFGGVGNLIGTLVSAFFLGIANKMLEPAAGAVLAKILILVLLILFIQKRPRGLFALKGRAVEA